MSTTPFKVKAIYEYTSNHEDDLPFPVGQIITVTDEEDADWYGGEYVDDSGHKLEGIFPRNFVEKFEPTAPPRPVRSRKKEAEPAAPAAPASPPPPATVAPEPHAPEPSVPKTEAPEQPAEEDHVEKQSEITHPEITHPETTAIPSQEQRSETPPPAQAPSIPVASPPAAAPVPAPAPIETKNVDNVGTSGIEAAPLPKPKPVSPVQARGAPPVAEKPMGNSFRDRIAAFNKPAAPPVAPFKPSGLGAGSSGFIKKPFVAPPPSRNAYVPPPRDPPVAKVYRREEDPEIKETQAESAEIAERAGLVSNVNSEAKSEDQPKPTTLKERIALLQKQQEEAALRHAEAAAKKEKPKRPPKKHIEVNDAHEGTQPDQPTDIQSPPERKDPIEAAGKESLEESQSTRQSLNIGRTATGAVDNDGNEVDTSGAGDTTEGQEELTEHDGAAPHSRTGPAHVPEEHAVANEAAEADEEEEEEEEDEIDPEIRRREELRARMAKMSGGMGMPGMFGPPGMMGFGGPPVKKPKPPAPVERRSSERSEPPSSPRMNAPPIPTLMALPGMGMQKHPEPIPEHEIAAESLEEEDSGPTPEHEEPNAGPEKATIEERPAPPPVPTESRPLPPPPPAALMSPSVGSESDDELSEYPTNSGETPGAETSPTTRAPPAIPVASPLLPTSPRFSSESRRSYMGDDLPLASPSLSPTQGKRNSRAPPPIPGIAPPAPTQTRPPPPPPPAALSRASTGDERIAMPMRPGRLDNGEEGDVAEYEGDYDTDIASAAPHRDALTGQGREPSFDTNNSALRSPTTEHPPLSPPPVPGNGLPRSLPPPIPSYHAPRSSVDKPRAGPPPIPTQPAPRSRASVDVPRGAPPPPPPPPVRQASFAHDDDYDPYNYNAVKTPPILSRSSTTHEEEQYAPYSASPPPPPAPPSSHERRTPGIVPAGPRAPPRKSLDMLRGPIAKRSMDNTARHSVSMETGFIATEIAESDLTSPLFWWKDRQGLPGLFQARKDIYTESTSHEDGHELKTRQLTVLFQDYSQTVITVRFDSRDPSQAEINQRQEPPPRSLRQDELEAAYERFGRELARSAAAKTGSVVGDGSPQALVNELLRPFPEALAPVGTRAYGALVYSNMANAATQIHDEIRPGDIISIRNARFQGKHGAMHARYTMEIGKPDHVAIVSEWDGTKKKVRAWEQGRENKKVKQESFKLDDLRSGEVKIWRVMPRTWVGLSARR
ncbi:hypothetical protein F5Y17DRAFT_434229 [Xylariaceae sp. FL0594]|nr:hypothetical protein F5Y17DRAFT_434229 [Xylariaceae sp. FL0594]